MTALRVAPPTTSTASFGAVLLAAAATFLGWSLVEDAAAAVSPLAAVLLLAMPLVVVGMPLPLLLARRRCAREGVRVTGRTALSTASRIDTLLLDKHRTVTTGDLKVVAIEPVEPDHARNLRWFAGALEHASEHPVGRAIAGLTTNGRLTNVRETPGYGIAGSVDQHPVRVGRPSWIGLDHPGGPGKTVAVEVDARPLGHITVADIVRNDAGDSVRRIRDLGVDPVLVADDTSLNTDRVAHQVGIETTHPEAAAEKRPRIVEELRERGRVIALAGEWATNAEALTTADLAISDAPPPGHDATVQTDDLDVGRVAWALRLLRRCHRITVTNARIVLAGLLLALPLAALGALAPLGSGLVAAVLLLTVAGNALRTVA